MSDIKNTIYDGMYTMFDSGTGYSLHGDAFQQPLTDTILETVGLRKSDWLGDWWVYAATDNPSLSWSEMIDLALNILHSEATRLFVSNLYLKEVPKYTPILTASALPVSGIRGAKRVNADRGTWNDYRGATGISGLYNPNRDEILRNPPQRDTGDKFRLSGKDESCLVEGAWFDWCCFACNILASENTNVLCPDLFEPALSNDNY